MMKAVKKHDQTVSSCKHKNTCEQSQPLLSFPKTSLTMINEMPQRRPACVVAWSSQCALAALPERHILGSEAVGKRSALNLLDVCTRENAFSPCPRVGTNPPSIVRLVLNEQHVILHHVDLLVGLSSSEVVQRFDGSNDVDCFLLLLLCCRRRRLHLIFLLRGWCIWLPRLSLECVDIFVHKFARVRSRLHLAPSLRQWLLRRLLREPRLPFLGKRILVHVLPRARS
mmetsp:Transcript_12985/g.33224  ORF Transcript_12985/g.33224 Transcript_12985/m.33224 type:complete len:227 (+) Transcript_12985:3356-4036(+)